MSTIIEPRTVMVTGGAGYIGSHICLALLEQGYEVVAVDNFCNSSRRALERVTSITGRQMKLYECDMRNGNMLMGIFDDNEVDAVIHLAGLKSVAESVKKPLEYYENNVGGTLTLLRVMALQGCKKLVFSSSATVYGDQPVQPVTEAMPLLPQANPYGRTKAVVEGMIADATRGGPELSAVLLRYFNPVGAHASGLLGEDPRGVPANLMPYLTGVASGRLPQLTVFGNDYDTPDGTGLRDYIHICDLAEGHVAALDALGDAPGLQTFNLGCGHAVSVLELVRAFEAATGAAVPYEIGPRREGDLAACWADTSRAKEVLGFEPKRSIEDMCLDAWLFEQQNPGGYGDEE